MALHNKFIAILCFPLLAILYIIHKYIELLEWLNKKSRKINQLNYENKKI